MQPARVFAVGFGIVAGVLITLGLPAGPASAHADLLSTDPPIGSVVASLPKAVTLTFDEAVQPVANRIQVVGPDGNRANAGPVSVDAKPTVSIPLRPGGPNGTYAVSYRIISDDGHPEIGVVMFSVGAPSAAPPVPVTTGGSAVSFGMELAMGAATFIALAGLVLVVGPVLFLLRLWPAGVSRRGAGLLVRVGLVAVAAGTLVEGYLQAPYSTGSTSLVATGDALRQVLASRYGWVHLARLAVLAAIAVPLARVIRGRSGRASRILVPAMALLGLATWPLAGHPRTSTLPVLTVVADAAHVGAVALWLGGLVTLLGFVLRHATTGELSRILPRWSRWAQRSVLVLVVGGVTEAVVEVRGFGPLVTTTYGQLLLVKVAVLALALAVAWYSRRVVRHRFDLAAPADVPPVPVLVASATPAAAAEGGPALQGRPPGAPDIGDPAHDTRHRRGVPTDQPPARRRLRRAVLVETAGLLVVLGVAMALVQTAPAASAQASSGEYVTGPGVVGGLVHTGMLENTTYTLQVRVSPAVVGTNHVDVFAYSRAGAPLTVLDWRAAVERPGRAKRSLDIPLTRLSGNHAAGQLILPSPGTWRLRFTLRTAGGPPTSVTGTLAVRPE